MTARDSVDALLAAADPAPAERIDPTGLDGRARTDLASILATAPSAGSEPAPARRQRRLLICAGAAVALALVVALVVPSLSGGGSTAYAATPRPLVYVPLATGEAAAPLLSSVAARAATLSERDNGGRFAHVEQRSWDLFTRVDGKRVTSEVVPQRTSQWLADDGSGLIRVVADLPGGTHREVRRAAGGELQHFWPLRSLSSDDRTLAAQLAQGHPVGDNGAAERLVAVQDAYAESPLAPPVRAALLRYVAATPGVVVTGRVTDRAGRDGVAVSLDSDFSGLPTRYTLIIDPDDGRLLGSESMLTERAGKLDVPVPSVIAYTVLLSADFTDAVG
jgi:hypothetical protein